MGCIARMVVGVGLLVLALFAAMPYAIRWLKGQQRQESVINIRSNGVWNVGEYRHCVQLGPAVQCLVPGSDTQTRDAMRRVLLKGEPAVTQNPGELMPLAHWFCRLTEGGSLDCIPDVAKSLGMTIVVIRG